jgi:hypothetical protein
VVANDDDTDAVLQGFLGMDEVGMRVTQGVGALIRVLVRALLVAAVVSVLAPVNARAGDIQEIPVDFYPGPAKVVVMGVPSQTTMTPGIIKLDKGYEELQAVRDTYEVRFVVGDYQSEPVYVQPYSKISQGQALKRAFCGGGPCCGFPLSVMPGIVQPAYEGTIWGLKPDTIYAINKVAAESLRRTEPVIRALHSKVEWVRADAAEVLGNIGDSSTAGILLPVLRDSSSDVRRAGFLALAKLSASGRLPEVIKPVLRDTLIQTLRCDAASEVRLASVEMLAGIKDSVVVAALIRAFHDRDEDIRIAAAEAAGRQDAAAVGPLADALADRDLLVRCCAALALGGIGPNAGSAVPRLVELFPVAEVATKGLCFSHAGLDLAIDRAISDREERYGSSIVLAEGKAQHGSRTYTEHISGILVSRYTLEEFLWEGSTRYGPSGRGAIPVEVQSEKRVYYDQFGRPGEIKEKFIYTLRYQLFAGAFALSRITGEDLGNDKAAWVQWLQQHQGEFGR